MRVVIRAVVGLALGFGLLFLVPATSALALTLTVTTTADGTDLTPGDGICASAAAGNLCTLRAAVQTANNTNGDVTIAIPTAGTYTLTAHNPGEDAAAAGDLDITNTTGTITIRGPNGGVVAIDGDASDRVFDVKASASLMLIGLTIQNGKTTTSSGGGILSSGTLTLSDVIVDNNEAQVAGAGIALTAGSATLAGVTISNNTAHGDVNGSGALYVGAGTTLTGTNLVISGNHAPNAGSGAGIYTIGSATLIDSTISGNTSSDFGGGVFQTRGSLTLTRVTVSGNTGSAGGGLAITQGGGTSTATLTNVTLSGNAATSSGGGGLGVTSAGTNTVTVTLTNVSVGPNTAATGGRGLDVVTPQATVNVSNSLFESSCATLAGGTITDVIGNVHDTTDAPGCPGTADDNVSVDLGSLQDNGGFTQTHALLAGSPALGVGNNATCAATDQRGVPRANGTGGDNCDAGAFELRAGTFAPVVAAIPTQTIDEDISTGPLAFRFANTNGASNGTNGITITPTGALTTSTITQGGTFPNETLTVIPPPDQNGGPLHVQVQVQSVPSGSPTTINFDVNVSAVNDAPVFAMAGNQTVNEDAGAQSVAGFVTSKAVGPATAVAFDEGGQSLTGVGVTVTNTTGNLAFTTSPAINLSTNVLTYQPAPNTNGTATVQVTLSDNGGTTNGGQPTSPPQTYTITVNAINDPPEFTLPATQTSSEDAGPVSVANFVTGIRPGPVVATDEAGQTLTFSVSVTGTTGNLSFTTPPAIDATTGTLTYQAAAGTNGTATVSVTLSDNGSNVAPNSNTSSPQTFTITVGSVNDPPVNTVPGTQTTPANTPKTFSTTNGNAISIADADAGSGSLQVNLAVTSGTLTLGSTAGLTVSGNGTNTVIASGTLANLNAGLQGLTFTPQSGFSGIVTLTVTTNDQGNTGGPAQTDTDQVTIGVGNLPLLSVADASVQEGNSGTTNLSFTVTLAPSSNLVVSVQAATADGTATAGSDYTSTTQTLTFQPGETSKTVSVPILGDSLAESDETLTLTLSSAQNALISRDKATGTIQNDDLGGTIQLSAASYSAGETDGAVTITVQRVTGVASSVGVQYATADGTAKAGQDYTAAAGTLTFAAGESIKTISVPILADRVDEPDESFTITLSNVTGGATLGTPVTATVTIRDVDQSTCQTTLTSNVPAGSTTIPVQSSAGCNVGDHVAINPGTGTEERTIITGFGSILIDQPTRYAHAAGEVVIRIGIQEDLGRAIVPPEDNQDKPQKLTDEERQQRQRTNRSGRDDEHTEGNVTAVACDASIPTITIANRDGLVEIQLLHEAVQSCSSARIGDYLEADGVKQTEQLFDADTITLRRGGQRVK
jgi:CSLREA domain-containing protein